MMKKKASHMKPKTAHLGGGATKVPHKTTVKAHPKTKPGAKMTPKKTRSMASAQPKKTPPVKGAKGHAGGKTKATKQENPFGHGDVIKFGFHGE